MSLTRTHSFLSQLSRRFSVQLEDEVSRLASKVASQEKQIRQLSNALKTAEKTTSQRVARANVETEKAKREGVYEFASLLFPPLDDFQRAFDAIPPRYLSGRSVIPLSGPRASALFGGIKRAAAALEVALASEGITPVQATGAAFDPALHDAVATAPGAAGKVVAELQRGYADALAERLLRPARVVVGTSGGD